MKEYIEECLESVCNDQDADIEVICVNDGSTDGTLDILEQWKQKDARVIVINQENKGVSVARNQGLHIAKGKFIYFLDSDDKVKDVAILEKCCEKMQEDQLDILIGAGKSFFETEEFYKKYSYYEKSYRIEHEYPRIMKGTELMAELQRNGEWAVQQSTRIYRRKFLQDNYVTFMCMYLTDRTTAVKDVLFERRIRENSIMTQKVTHKNVEGYLVNFIQDLYLIADYRDVKSPNMDMGFPLDIARRDIKRTYRLLDEEEKKSLEERLTEEQKFYFDALIRREIEAEDRMDAKSKFLERVNRENKEVRQKQEIRILNLEQQLTKLEADRKQEQEKNDKLQQKIKETNKDLKKANKKIKEMKESTSWKIGRAITWPVRKLKTILRKFSNGNA